MTDSNHVYAAFVIHGGEYKAYRQGMIRSIRSRLNLDAAMRTTYHTDDEMVVILFRPRSSKPYEYTESDIRDMVESSGVVMSQEEIEHTKKEDLPKFARVNLYE